MYNREECDESDYTANIVFGILDIDGSCFIQLLKEDLLGSEGSR